MPEPSERKRKAPGSESTEGGQLGAERVRGFGTSIFSEVSLLAQRHGAVNLGQGFPDFAAPDFVKEAARRHIAEDRNQYAPSSGSARLRQALARHRTGRFGRALDAETEITVTSGATEALLGATLALVNPGDEVIVFEPFYDAYVPNVIMAGGIPKVVRLHPPLWRFDPDELRGVFSARTRLIIVNTPHNPTGKVFERQELACIAELCQTHDALALTDEVYADLVYDGVEHLPLATLPGMWERTLTVESMGKTFSVTGWKVGWVIGPAALNRALRLVHQFVTFATATPFQEALADVLDLAEKGTYDEGTYYDSFRADYTRRRDKLAAALGQVGLPIFPVQGSYFLVADLKPLGFDDDLVFCRRLIEERGVAAIPTSVFYQEPRSAPPMARFCFAKRDETLDGAAARLAPLLQP